MDPNFIEDDEMTKYIMYFYEKDIRVDNFSFITYDDFSAIKKAERIVSCLVYTKARLYRDAKLITEIKKEEM